MRIFLLTLLTALVIAPSQASAASTGCDVEPGPYAPASHDQTVVSNTDWQKGNPLGSIKVPLVGTDVDAFEYSVDCGAPVVVNAASSSATITGEGELRFRHRARVKADAVSDGGLWTDWVEETVRIDSGRPANETPIITSEWRPGPAQFPVRATDTTSPAHVKWRVDEGSWNTTSTAIVDGTGVHTLDTAAVDSAGNESQMPFTVSIDNEAPVDRTQQAPVDFQSQAVDLTVDGADAHSGVKYVEWQIDAQTPHSGPDGTIVRIDAHGKHTFQTRAVDKVGNKSAWRSQNVWIQSPTDLTKVSTGWYTTPTVKVDIVGTDSTNRQLKRIQWRLDDQPEQDVSNPVNNTVPVTVSGDRDHELAVRMTDADDNVLEWHSHRVKIDTVHPTDLTKVADGWLPQDSLTVDVHGSDATSKIGSVEWRIDDGNDNSAPGDHHDVTVAGEGIHTLETRVIDNAGKESAWVPRTIKLDPSAPTNLTPIAPTGWRNTPYSVTLDGSDALSDVASVSWKVKLEGLTESAERSGAAGAVTAAINQDGTHTLSTRVRDLAGIASAWRTEVIQIDRVLPTDATVYPSTPVNPRHVITFNPQDDRSGVAKVEWSLDGATASTDPSVTIKGTGAHTLSVSVTDNANNKTGWVDHTITVVLPPDKTAPTDKTSIPTNWLTDDYTVTLAAEDDIDGVGVDYVEWRLDGSAIKLGKAGDTFPVKGDGAHRVDTRVRDKNGNRTGWNTQTVRIDKTPPTDSSGIAGGWAKTRTISFKADDASSGVEYITYDITGPSPKSGTINASSGTSDARLRW